MLIAMWQTPYATNLADALTLLDTTAQAAAQKGTQLLVCPEMSLTGYNLGATTILQLAESPFGPLSEAVSAICKKHQIAIIYGYPQSNLAGGKPFNAVQCISAQGKRLSNHRKTRLFGELDANQFTAAESIAPTFELAGRQIALLICYEVEFAQTVKTVAQLRPDVLIVPTANMIEFDAVQDEIIPRHARDHALPIVYVNACGSEDELRYGGLSLAVSGEGKTVVRAGRESALCFVEISRLVKG